MRISGKILVALAIVVALVSLARNTILESLVKRTIQKNTEFGASMDKVDVGILQPTFELLGFKLLNPPDFPEQNAIDINRLFVKYDRLSLMSPRIHLPELSLDMPRIVMVKKEDKQTNLSRLRRRPSDQQGGQGGAGEPGQAPGSGRPEGGGSQPSSGENPARPRKEMTIDSLTVKIGKVEVHDYSKGHDKPDIQVYNVNIDRTYNNVTNLEALGNQIALEVMLQGGMNELNKKLNDPTMAEKLNKSINKLGKSIGDFLKKQQGTQE